MSDNPFALPCESNEPQPCSTEPSFGRRAAIFSILAPFIALPVGFLVPQLGAVPLLTMLAGIVFGVVGFVSGLRHQRTSTAVMGLLGVVLNGGIVALATSALIMVMRTVTH